MATAQQHLDSMNDTSLPSGEGKVVAIIRAEWNDEITSALAEGAHNTLVQHGVDPEHILSIDVPGAVELTYAAKRIHEQEEPCLLYTSPSPRDRQKSRMPSSA